MIEWPTDDAEVLAFCDILGDPVLRPEQARTMGYRPASEMAEAFGLCEKVARERLNEAATEGEVETITVHDGGAYSRRQRWYRMVRDND